MHGSTSPSKKGSPSCSHWTFSRTSLTARRASALAGSRPNCLSSIRLHAVEVHSGKSVPRLCGGIDRHHFSPASVLNSGVPPSHCPSSRWRASNLAPQPSLAMRARSAATSSAGASMRSRITCQRIAGSESSSQSITFTAFKSSRTVPYRLNSLQREPGEQCSWAQSEKLPSIAPQAGLRLPFDTALRERCGSAGRSWLMKVCVNHVRKRSGDQPRRWTSMW